MVRIYRIEKLDCTGPYEDGVFDSNDFDLIRQPAPGEDGLGRTWYYEVPNHRFGFRSIPALHQWFYDNERSRLSRHGFIVAEYEAHGAVKEGGKQCVFDAAQAQRVAQYHVLDI